MWNQSIGLELSVLVIDDDALIIKAVEEILSKKGLTVDSFSCALEASKKIGSLKDHYDVIICDIRMPKMSGIDFAQTFYQDYPIVLMTSYLDDIQRRSVGNICDAYIEKFEAHDRLYPAILKAIERKNDRQFEKRAA